MSERTRFCWYLGLIALVTLGGGLGLLGLSTWLDATTSQVCQAGSYALIGATAFLGSYVIFVAQDGASTGL